MSQIIQIRFNTILTQFSRASNMDLENTGRQKDNHDSGFPCKSPNQSNNNRGVCDKKDERIGELTAYGNKICSCEYVLEYSKVIFASTTSVYEVLINSQYKGHVVNLQKYMPWG